MVVGRFVLERFDLDGLCFDNGLWCNVHVCPWILVPVWIVFILFLRLLVFRDMIDSKLTIKDHGTIEIVDRKDC